MPHAPTDPNHAATSPARPGRALVTSVAVVVAGLAIALIAFEVSVYPTKLVAQSRHQALPAMLDQLDAPAEIAVMGDSRVIHGVRPSVIANVFSDNLGVAPRAVNLGLPGAPPVAMLGFAEHLVARTPPRVVVLALSHYMFSTAQDPQNAREPILALFHATDLPRALLAGMPFEEASEALAADLFAPLRFRSRILSRLLEGKLYTDDDPFAVTLVGPPTEPGWLYATRVTAPEQRRRMSLRAEGTRKVMNPDEPDSAKLFERQFGYLASTIALLQSHGVRVVLMESPTASGVWPYLSMDAKNLYPVVDRRIADIAQRYAVPWLHHRPDFVVPDSYYTDGDHLSPDGAARFTALLTHRILIPAWRGEPIPAPLPDRWTRPAPSPNCELLFDFEATTPETFDTPGAWEVDGDAFATLSVTGSQGAQADIVGAVGYGLVNTATAESGDRATGSATSSEFVITAPSLHLKVGGGRFPRTAAVVLEVDREDGERARFATGEQSENLREVVWDVSEFIGLRARLRIIDSEASAWGHLVVDQIEACHH